ncbi:MAG TPA: hypothetical protein VNT81_23720 [Vicinamibacterales bacterium]|jgi:hypothetical protein|nr:hypothetical protein [Vicinamibacterales bacterium]
MKNTFLRTLVFVALGLAAFAPASGAQSYASPHQDHTMTFDTPIRLVTGATLAAGTYIFSFPSPSQLGITRILSTDRSKIYATLHTTSRTRAAANGFDVVLVTDGPAGSPRTLTAWFCDGNKVGHEFVVEKAKH